MVRLRLQRYGAKRNPRYRVVAADQRKARNGRFIEQLGTYDPTQEPPLIRLDGERIEYWMEQGAQPTDTVRSFVKRLRAGDVVDLSEEGADEAAREELERKRREEIEKRRAEIAEKIEARSDEEEEEETEEAEEAQEDAEASEDEGAEDEGAEEAAEDENAEEESTEDEEAEEADEDEEE